MLPVVKKTVQTAAVGGIPPNGLGKAISLHNDGQRNCFWPVTLAFQKLAREGNREAQYYLGMAYDHTNGAWPRPGFERLCVGNQECEGVFGKVRSEDHRYWCELYLESGRRCESDENTTEATFNYCLAAQYGSVDAYWHLGFLELQRDGSEDTADYWFGEWRKWNGSETEARVDSSEYVQRYPLVLYWFMRNKQNLDERRSGLFHPHVDGRKLSLAPEINPHWPLEEEPTQEQLAQALCWFAPFSTHYEWMHSMTCDRPVKYRLESAKLGCDEAKKQLYKEYWDNKVLPREYAETVVPVSPGQTSGADKIDVELALLTACYYLYCGNLYSRDTFRETGRQLLLTLGGEGVGQAYYLLAWNLSNDPKAQASDIDHYLELATQHGQHVASGYRGWRYHFGIGVQQNSDTARRYYEQAARHGSWERSYLGLIALKAKGISVDLAIPDTCPQKDIANTEELTFLAHTKKNPEARYALGVLYEKGICMHQSYSNAVRFYKKANQPDLHQACLRIARLTYQDKLSNESSHNDWILNVFREIPPGAGQIYCEARFEIAYLLEHDKARFNITYFLPLEKRSDAVTLPHHHDYEIALHYYQATRTGNVKFEGEVGERVTQFAEKVNPAQRVYDVAMKYKELSLTNEERSRYLALADKLDHPNAAVELYLWAKARETLMGEKNSEQDNIQLFREKVSWLKRAAVLGHEEAKEIIGGISFDMAKYLVDNWKKNRDIPGYSGDIDRCLRIAQAYQHPKAKSLATRWHDMESKRWKAELDAEEMADLKAKKEVVRFARALVDGNPQTFTYEEVDSAVQLHDDI